MVDKVILRGRNQTTGIYEVTQLPVGELLKIERLYIELFNEAFALYEKGDFSSAEKAFLECLRRKPGDHVAAMLKDRCIEFLKSGLPPSWDGTIILSEK